jgi:hypothetical protein
MLGSQQPKAVVGHVRYGREVFWAIGALCIAAVSAVSSVGVIVARSRGLDLSDESLYILSYRYYRAPEMMHVGSGAFFGPIFRILGDRVDHLRAFKLLSVLVIGKILGHAVVARLRSLFTQQSVSNRESHFIVALVVSGGLLCYSWLPQTPSYNDLSALCAAAVLATVFCVESRTRSGAWLVLLGSTLTIAFINKWTAGVLLGGIALCRALAVDAWRRLGWRFVGARVGLGGAAVVVGLFLVGANPVRYVVANARVARSNAGRGRLLDTYALSYWRTLKLAALEGIGHFGMLALLVAVAVGVVVVARQRAVRIVAGAAAGLAAVLCVPVLIRVGAFEGGSGNLSGIELTLPCLMGLSLVPLAVSAVLRGRSLPRRSIALDLATIVAVWLAPAVGTDNSLLAIAHSGGAVAFAFIAVIIASVVRVRRAFIPAGVVMGVVCSLVASGAVFRGLWLHPYRIEGELSSQNSRVEHVALLDGIQVDQPTADFLESLAEVSQTQALRGANGFSSFGSPGVAIALGLRHPLAALWVRAPGDPGYQTLYADRIRTACESGFFDESVRPVVVSLSDRPEPRIADVIREAGCRFDNYDVVSVLSPGFPTIPEGEVLVWIPNDL